MDCAINFTIDTTGVKQINDANQQITIVKSTSTAGKEKPVAWISFEAMNAISVTWTEEYFIYASLSKIEDDMKIVESSATDDPIEFSELYKFSSDVFSMEAGGSDGMYTAKNDGGKTYTMGLAQSAIVNGKAVSAPINAVSVLNAEEGTFKPRIKLSVFLSGTQDNGTVLSHIQGNAFTFELSSDQATVDLGFSDTNNTFHKLTTKEFARSMRVSALANK
ncbi:MAG: hypothetical protein ACRYGP_07695 [Janthinobacterium lividum]